MDQDTIARLIEAATIAHLALRDLHSNPDTIATPFDEDDAPTLQDQHLKQSRQTAYRLGITDATHAQGGIPPAAVLELEEAARDIAFPKTSESVTKEMVLRLQIALDTARRNHG